MFEQLTPAKPDPILGLADLYQADERSHKINLSIGIYKDENCTTPILNSVKKAEQFLIENELNKIYLPIDGLKSFNLAVQALILGQNSELIESGRVKTLQTPGGTGALKVMADFFAQKTDVKKVWVSNPTWPNHYSVFKNAGIEVGEYRYYNPETHDLNEEAFFADLNNIPAGDVVLFHGCCHNPSGIDPTLEQWQKISDIALAKGWFPAFDFAYQGFGQGLDEDALGIRLFANAHPELMIASSYSKNFGLYNERVGALTVIANDKEAADCTLSQLKTVVRANYSNPPLHGASVVSHILNTPDLKDEWLDELTLMRERIHRMRLLFVKTLQEKGTGHDFSFIGRQNGMFSFSGLTEAQVLALREQYGIYFVNSGRINIAGMTLDNMSRLCESIISVISE